MGWVFDLQLPTREKFVLLAYADHADHDGMNIYPAIQKIAEKTGYNERTVQRASRILEEWGLLIPNGSGPQGTKRWRINLQWQGVTESHPDTQSPRTTDTGGVTHSPQGGVRRTPEPSLTVIKPSTEEEGEGRPNVFRIYEQEIGVLTPVISDKLKIAEDDHTAQWVAAAIRIASANSKRSWAYVDAILRRWQVDGYGSDFPARKNGNGSNRPKPLSKSNNQRVLERYQEKHGHK